MLELRLIELLITAAVVVATILGTYFAWRAVREGKNTVTLARETVEVGKETLGIERENLSTLQETTRLGQESLELATTSMPLVTSTASSSVAEGPIELTDATAVWSGERDARFWSLSLRWQRTGNSNGDRGCLRSHIG